MPDDDSPPEVDLSRIAWGVLLLIPAMALGLWLVSRAHLTSGVGDEIAKALVGAPVIVTAVLAFMAQKRRIARVPPVFLPLSFSGTARPAAANVEELGPAAVEVESFLARVRAMSEAEWEAVLRPEMSGLSPYRRQARRALRAADAALGEDRQGMVQRTELRALVRSVLAEDADRLDMNAPSFAYAAALGLLARDSISQRDFNALYGPFEAAIPSKSIDRLTLRGGLSRRGS